MKLQIPDLVLYETIESKFATVLSKSYLPHWRAFKDEFNSQSLYPDLIMIDDTVVGLVFDDYVILPQNFVDVYKTILKVDKDCYSFYTYICNFLIFKKDEIYITDMTVKHFKRYKE